MIVGTTQTTATHALAAVNALAEGLAQYSATRPDFLAIHFGVGFDVAPLHAAAVGAFGAGSLHGGSSCLGVMGPAGPHLSGAGIGALAIWDADGSFGTASADLANDAKGAAEKAALAALIAAGRPGEMPDMVWLTVAPGREEEVLAGLRAVVGRETLIVGGTSADNNASGSWVQFGPHAVHCDGVVVSVLFPSCSVASVYQSGYAPTGANGVVTEATGRRLYQIGGRPALVVYDEWTAGALQLVETKPGNILPAATLWPLGRITHRLAGVPFHLLLHPVAFHLDGSLDLFADVQVGDRLWQMQGSMDRLVARAGRVAAQARSDVGGSPAGALVVYCGGCMLAVQDRIDEINASINSALGGIPWLGIHTFGEQGAPNGHISQHGNLMISCTVFAK